MVGGAGGHEEDAAAFLAGFADGLHQLHQVPGDAAPLLPDQQQIEEGQGLAGGGVQAGQVGQELPLVGDGMAPPGVDHLLVSLHAGREFPVHGIGQEGRQGGGEGGLFRYLVEGQNLVEEGLAEIPPILEGGEEAVRVRRAEVVAQHLVQVVR